MDPSQADDGQHGLECREETLREILAEQFAATIDPREGRRRGDSALRLISRDALPLFERLQPGEIRVRVGNPPVPRDRRTTIEILIADIPFLVDTLRLSLRRLGLRELLLLHPLVPVDRDGHGAIARIGKASGAEARESYLYCEVPRMDDAARLGSVKAEIQRVFAELRDVVADHGRMVKALRRHTAEIEFSAGALAGGVERVRMLMGFLDWLADDNFIFLGYRQYRTRPQGDDWTLQAEPETGLGMLADASRSRFASPVDGEGIPPIIRSRLADSRFVFFDKSQIESVIHRAGRLDSISIKMLDENGELCGFGKILGLLTHKAIRARGSEIPILRERRDAVLEELGVEVGSYADKAAKEAFDSLPVEFLFPFAVKEVSRAVKRIMAASELHSVEVFAVPDPLNRSFFVSAILPRVNYEETLREEIRTLLMTRFGATYVDSRSMFLDDEIALIHFFCSSADDIDLDTLVQLERSIEALAADWQERFERALLDLFPAANAQLLVEAYSDAFPDEYRAFTSAEEAVLDVRNLEKLRQTESQLEIAISDDPHGEAEMSRLKVYQRTRPFLTDLLPVIDHFGLQVVDATLTELCPDLDEQYWIVTFRIKRFSTDSPFPGRLDERVLDGLRAAFNGRVEEDSLNRLILGADLDWRSVDVLRAYLAYAKQLGRGPMKQHASDVLLAHPDATHALIALFRARFDPDLGPRRAEAEQWVLARLQRCRKPIRTFHEDRVFGVLANLIQSTSRTNFFSARAEEVGALVLKIDPRRIEQAPAPVPFAEIFVHAPDLSAVHLRGGPLARGGIRWSERPEDFRTEILHLMKTQMVKNGLIVPVGAKGGFVLKHRFSSAAEAREEADRQYARFMRCLLSLTDNVVADEVVPPPDVVRHDGDDAYLVVAADKGTAHLSDVANRVAEEEAFWLGDAFASGGSRGYDHKREGITARGAWVCAKRHLLELGIDIDEDTYTVAGIGDMSGDVFGNGMLLAHKAKLVAAFNHAHIFLDPDPDPETAWRERSRLFGLGSSGWPDYDAGAISPGGGVFARDAKSIELSPRAREALGVEHLSLSGEEVVRAILRMPVDLLWNGGIGTYVRASSETDVEIGDRENANVRIDATELRARVVCEGGNLGLTQSARVEFALGGGRINTDAIDNSAGVDLSDHEVNLKVLLTGESGTGAISRDDRDRWLRACLGHASESVLAHNAAQSRCLSMDRIRSREDPERMLEASRFLSRNAGLDWRLERLPSRDALRSRTAPSGERLGYTRPELGILLGYTKLLVERRLAESDLPDRPLFVPTLFSYFPEPLRGPFEQQILSHRLRREIVATALTNRIIDRAGVTLVPELVRDAGVSIPDVIVAHYTADRLLEAEHLRRSIELEPVEEQQRLRAWIRIEQAVREGARSRLALEPSPGLAPDDALRWIALARSLREVLSSSVGPIVGARVEEEIRELESAGFSSGIARQLASLQSLVRAFGVLSLAVHSDALLPRVARLHARVGEETRIAWMLERLTSAGSSQGWDRIACEALYIEMLETQRQLTERVLEAGVADDAPELFAADQSPQLRRIADMVAQIDAEPRAELSALTVLSRQIRALC